MTTSTPVVAPAISEALGRSADNENKFLSFCLGSEEYGLEILRVREIIGIMDITPLPQTPEYVKGVINLRGKIIPVIALRTKFGLPSVEHTDATCVIVVEVRFTESTEQFSIGVIVDTVNEVLDIQREQIEPAPDFGCNVNTEYILGIGTVDEKVVILLDIDKLMTESEVKALKSAATRADGATSLTSAMPKAA